MRAIHGHTIRNGLLRVVHLRSHGHGVLWHVSGGGRGESVRACARARAIQILIRCLADPNTGAAGGSDGVCKHIGVGVDRVYPWLSTVGVHATGGSSGRRVAHGAGV